MYSANRLHRCCFTGHRPEKLITTEAHIKIVENKIKSKLRPIIAATISDGYKTFLTGMARGFDLWAADIVLEEKTRNPNIHLICVLPFKDFEKRWSYADRDHYRAILNKADYIKLIAPEYSAKCFQIRNEYLVNHSSRVITAYNGLSGGTRNTINYAKKLNIEIINILENEL